jgi:hypothetical protein
LTTVNNPIQLSINRWVIDTAPKNNYNGHVLIDYFAVDDLGQDSEMVMEEIMTSCRFMNKRGLLVLCVVVTFLVTSLPAAGTAATSGEFSGTWVANGSREEFPFSPDREIYTFELSGHVSLKDKLGKKKDYWSDCVGFSDSMTGAVARCVWKDLNGSQIYISLKSKPLHEGGEVTGTIIGGSDRLQGISGDLSFVWASLSFQKENGKSTVVGQTLDLKGNYQLP